MEVGSPLVVLGERVSLGCDLLCEVCEDTLLLSVKDTDWVCCEASKAILLMMIMIRIMMMMPVDIELGCKGG